eukprot:449069-Pelagomonas_calceolata.AAC.2
MEHHTQVLQAFFILQRNSTHCERGQITATGVKVHHLRHAYVDGQMLSVLIRMYYMQLVAG